MKNKSEFKQDQSRKNLPILMEFSRNDISIFNNPLFYSFDRKAEYFNLIITKDCIVMQINRNYLKVLDGSLTIREGFYDKNQMVTGVQHSFLTESIKYYKNAKFNSYLNLSQLQSLISNYIHINIDSTRKKLNFDNFTDLQNRIPSYNILNSQVIYYDKY